MLPLSRLFVRGVVWEGNSGNVVGIGIFLIEIRVLDHGRRGRVVAAWGSDTQALNLGAGQFFCAVYPNVDAAPRDFYG